MFVQVALVQPSRSSELEASARPVPPTLRAPSGAFGSRISVPDTQEAVVGLDGGAAAMASNDE
jgi:hypothetical protein